MKHSSSAHLNPLASEGGAGLDLPHAIPDGVQIETLCDLGGWGGGQEVLFVCKDQHRNTAQLLLIQQLSQLLQRTHICQLHNMTDTHLHNQKGLQLYCNVKQL